MEQQKSLTFVLEKLNHFNYFIYFWERKAGKFSYKNIFIIF